MRVIYTLLSAFFLCMAFLVKAQSITVKGMVQNSGGEPLTGVSVTIKGTITGTVTDKTGSFALTVTTLPFTLIITGVGYTLQEYTVTEKNVSENVRITMTASEAMLSEVVVTGYAVARKRSATASASSSLSGRVAGVSVTSGHRYDRTVASKPATIGVEGKAVKEDGSRAHILTAGELSDFKKWKLWGDYSTSEFSTWSQHWGIAFNYRYCVQVQNRERKALAGQKVYLLDANTNDTVWQAVTDNTGKAELWGRQSETTQGRYRIISGKEVIYFPTLFENGINRITLQQSCNISNTVDIAFAVDATGSMGDEIRYLQKELQDIISRTAKTHKDVTIRTGSVFYRDRGDEYLTRHVDFQTDPSALIRFIENQSAGGGGDTPEAVEAALATALDSLHWSETARSRILFLVLDAPPHDEVKGKMEVLIQKAAAKGIRIVPVVCSGIDKSTEYLMRCISLATNGTYVFLTDDSGVGNKHLKPTTDEFKVELLNALIQRLIGEMIMASDCEGKEPVTAPADAIVANTTQLVVYPNPSRGNVQVESSQPIEELLVTDFTGKVLLKKDVSNKRRKWNLDLSAYPAGTYLAKYLVKDKGWESAKIIVVH